MITSRQNARVKAWKKLHTVKGRKETGMFLIEGYHLIEEAWKSNCSIQEILIRPGNEIPDFYESFPNQIVTEEVFSDIAQTKTPQGVIAVVRQIIPGQLTGNLLLLIDGIQDPGNLGTMIRTADAAGFSGIVLGAGTVDLYNEKVIRATQGSIFHILIVHTELLKKISILKQTGYSIWATALENATNYRQVAIPNKTALIIGNEGAGIHPELINLADSIVNIPIYGQAESLNASIAAGVLMYHLRG